MPSHNESTLRHSKTVFLGCIMHISTIYLRLRTSQEVDMGTKKKHTSLPFHILIMELDLYFVVSEEPTRDIEVTPLSATDIKCFEDEYIHDKVDRRRETPVYSSL